MGLKPSKPHRPYPLVTPGINIQYGQNPLYLPPQLQSQNSSSTKKKRKSRRNGSVSEEEKLAQAYVQGWHAGQTGMGPQPALQPVNQRQPLADNNRPVVPPPPVPPTAAQTTQRSQTPFTGGTLGIPQQQEPVVPQQPFMPQGQQQQQDPQVSQQQFGQPQAPDRANPDIARVLQPLPPPNPVVYGPPPLQQPMPRLANPLPTPPRDLYELSPYNTLLNLPQTTALLTAAYTQQGGLPPPNYGSRGRRSGGLLRALTGRGRKEEDVRFVPVFINGQPQPQHSSSNSTQQQSGAGPGVPEPPTGPAAFAGGQQPPVVLQDPSQPQFYTPEPTFGNEPFGAAPVGGPVRFSASSFPGFLNYSPHRILYNEQYYPSVMHLYEAMKYLPDNPVLAERIRLCPDVGGVHPLSEQLLREAPARHDWARVHLDYMTEAILHKFRQHPDLRAMLLGTGNAPLIYADEQDTFWGEGPGQSGENHLGRILETVREELRREGGLL